MKAEFIKLQRKEGWDGGRGYEKGRKEERREGAREEMWKERMRKKGKKKGKKNIFKIYGIQNKIIFNLLNGFKEHREMKERGRKKKKLVCS